ncbi:MAG: PQQ-binding-like beta-propeller repeat protein, partial [Bryobacteraceae bacterium]
METFVVLFLLASVNWPGFRGPNASGVADASKLPVRVGREENVVWKTALPAGHSSPALTADRIFLTGSEGDKLITFSLDRETGKILWRREVTRNHSIKLRVRNTPASPTPVTDGKNVYAFFDEFGLVAYGPDGEERWRHPLGPFIAPYGMAASPLLVDGKIVLLCDQDTGSFLLAVDGLSGKQVWKVERSEYL